MQLILEPYRKLYFWPQSDTPDFDRKSLAGNGKVHKSAIQALKLWNKPSRPIGFCI